MLTGSNVCPPPATIHPVTVGTLRSESESTCHWLPDFGQPVFFDFRSMKYEDTGRRRLRTSGTTVCATGCPSSGNQCSSDSDR